MHKELAKALELREDQVRVVAPPVGGGFGGKLELFQHEAAAAKLAMLTGRPIKAALNREEVFYCHRGRHPVLMWLKTGWTSDGKLAGIDFQSFVDGGAYTSYGAASLYYTGALQTVCEHVPAYRWQGVRVLTNKPPCGPKRGHGTPQPRFALECHFDAVAEQLGIPVLELRRKNFLVPYSKTVNHLRITSNGLRECVDIVARESQFEARHGKLPFGKGIGFAVGSYLCGAGLPLYWNDMPHSSVDIRLDRSGVVTVACGQIDIGQGSNSMLVSVVAEALGARPEQISLISADTDLTPIDLGSYSSRVTFMAGNAAISAATQLRNLLVNAAADELDVPVDELILRRGTLWRRDGLGPRLTFRAGKARRNAQRIAHRHWQLQAAATGRTVQGVRRRAESGVQLLRGGCRSGRRSRHRLGDRRKGVDGPRHRACPESGTGRGPGGGQHLHGARRGADGGAGVSRRPRAARARRASDSVDARVQEPDHVRDARDPHLPGRDDRPRGAIRRKGGRPGPAAAGHPRRWPTRCYDAVGVRIDETPITPEKILRAMEARADGKPGRVGPTKIPTYPFPRTITVPPPWDMPDSPDGPDVSEPADRNGTPVAAPRIAPAAEAERRCSACRRSSTSRRARSTRRRCCSPNTAHGR